jgi:5'-nucleotidase (lipoprotein e(P4) family)
MSYLHHNNVDALLWLQTSAEWHASFLQAYELAKVRIDQAMADAEEGARYCITTDLDETLFDNSAYNEWLVTSGHNFNETGSWDAYCRAVVSRPMPGVEAFYGWLAATHPGVRVFFVTSRLETVRAATAENLAAFANVPASDAASADPTVTSLFLKGFNIVLPDGQGAEKYDQYRYIEEVLGYQTILRLGDNASDFHPDFGSRRPPTVRLAAASTHAAEWGRRWIQFPNPVYGGFLLSLRNPDGSPITEDEGTALGMTDKVARPARTAGTTPKVELLNPWTP